MSTGKKKGQPNRAQSQNTGTSLEAPSGTVGTSLGGTSLGSTSLGGTSLGGTALGGTSIGGTTSGTALGGTALGGTSLGGTSLGGTSLGGSGSSAGGTAGGTSIGGTASGTSLGGTSLGGTPAVTAGTSLGGTSLGGAASTGTTVGGTSLGGNTGGGKKKGKQESNTVNKPTPAPESGGTSLGGSASSGTTVGGTSLGGTSLGSSASTGTTVGSSAGTSLGGTALGGSGSSAGTSLGGTSIGGTSLGGTALGGSTGNAGTSLGSSETSGTSTPATSLGGSVGTALGGSGGAPADGDDDDEGDDEEGGAADGEKKKKKKKKKKPAATPAPAAAPAAKPVSKQGKAAAAMAAKVKALQVEQERIRKEEEERIKREEEEDKKRIEDEMKAEEERIKQAEIKKTKREEEKKRQAELEAQRKREEAMKKYGLDPNLVAGFGRGRGGQRGKGPRGGGQRGGRGRGGKDGGRGESDKKDVEVEEQGNEEHVPENNTSESSAPEPATSTEPPKEAVAEDWETEDWETQLSDKNTEAADKTKEPAAKVDEEKQKAEEQKKLQEQKKLEEQKKKEEREQEKKRKEEEEQKRKEELERKKEEQLAKQQNAQKLRSPIVCVLGHVDTGKTLLLDKIRSSNIQAGEAGGITQQIGATYFPNDVIRSKTKELTESLKTKLSFKLPGLLIIDTPGHESFSNLRSRGSSLCDIAILVIDIMHGLEPQTRESIRLLKSRNTPFIVALNKVDRIFGWQSIQNGPLQTSLAKQDQATKQRFEERVKFTVADLAGEGMNSCVYYQNKDFKKTVSLVPTSAVTGEGIPDLLMLLVQLSQTMMGDKLLELSELDCTVLEVKKLAGRGTTLDVILANGVLRQNDKIVVCGLNGEPIVTHIRNILTPPLLGEMRSKNTQDLVSNKEVRAAIGCKIDAPGLDDAVAGSQLFVVKPGDDIEKYKTEVMSALNTLEGKVDKSGFGVYVQASTLGSMEALLEFLKEVCKIPVSGIRIGPVHKKDVMRSSVMLEHKKEYACILAFDVKVMPDAREFAEKLGVRIFEADIIYHLEEMFQKYLEEVASEKKTNLADQVVFPCILTILPDHIYKTRNPIVLGVKVEEGILKVNTPIVVPSQNKIELGSIKGIRKSDQTEVEEAQAGEEVSVEIVPDATKQKHMYGRHFTEADKLVSLLTRHSIDALKESHPEVCKTREIFKLIQQIKQLLGIQ